MCTFVVTIPNIIRLLNTTYITGKFIIIFVISLKCYVTLQKTLSLRCKFCCTLSLLLYAYGEEEPKIIYTNLMSFIFK